MNPEIKELLDQFGWVTVFGGYKGPALFVTPNRAEDLKHRDTLNNLLGLIGSRLVPVDTTFLPGHIFCIDKSP